MSDTNLLKETIEYLERCEKNPSDVRWVGGKEQWFTWDEFVAVANVTYDSGYGSPKVAQDLVVVGYNWWLERYEYDGAESWQYKDLPLKPTNKIVPKNLTGGMWNDLKELNEDPTPWCHICSAMKRKQCRCDPTAENE